MLQFGSSGIRFPTMHFIFYFSSVFFCFTIFFFFKQKNIFSLKYAHQINDINFPSLPKEKKALMNEMEKELI